MVYPRFWKCFAAPVFGLALLLSPSLSRAQAPTGPDTSSSTTEDSTGKITAVSDTTVTVNSRRGPFTYRLGNDIHVIGPKDQHYKVSDIHVGQQATVYYYLRDGMPTVARLVVISEASRKKGG